MRNLHELKEQVLEEYRKCYDKTTAFTICKCSKEEKIALLEDEEFSLELGAIKGSVYAKDIAVYDDLIKACQVAEDKELTEKVRNFLREEFKKEKERLNVGQRISKAEEENAKTKMLKVKDRYTKFISGLTSANMLNTAQILLKALEKRQELLFNQMNQNADEDKAMNISFYRLEAEDLEKNPQVEIVKGTGVVKENFGKQDEKELL